jgi:hypothetical protein
MVVMVAQKELIGHAGDVIADDDVARFHPRKFFVESGHRAGSTEIEGKKLFETVHGVVAVLGDGGMAVNAGEKEALELGVAGSGGFAEAGEAFGRFADVVCGGDAGDRDALHGRFDEIGGQRIEDALEGFVEFEFFASARVHRIHLRVNFAEERNFAAQRGKIEQLGFESVVDVRGVVSDFIDPVDELGFERWEETEKVFAELGKFGRGIVAGVLDDAFANFEGEIEAGKIEIALFELLDDAKRVEIVIEMAAVRAHEFIELFFSGMAEGRMADVVDEREGFRKLGVQAEGGGHGAGDLRDFESVREAIAEMIGVARGENLRLGFQPAEGAGMDDAVAVARVDAAVRMRRLRKAAAAGLLCAHRPGSRSGKAFDGPLRSVPAEPREA